MCRKSAGITENIQEICRYNRKCAENLQVLQNWDNRDSKSL